MEPRQRRLINYYGINDSYFEYVVEDSVIKHNKYIPGTNIRSSIKQA